MIRAALVILSAVRAWLPKPPAADRTEFDQDWESPLARLASDRREGWF